MVIGVVDGPVRVIVVVLRRRISGWIDVDREVEVSTSSCSLPFVCVLVAAESLRAVEFSRTVETLEESGGRRRLWQRRRWRGL